MSRVPLVDSPEQLLERAEAYFDSFKDKPAEDEVFSRPTYTGLILALGFHSRQNLYDYSQREEYAEAIAYVKLMMEQVYELNLHLPNPTGSIFALKNMGWSDKQEHEITGADKGPIEVSDTERAKRIAELMEIAKRRADEAQQDGLVGE